MKRFSLVESAAILLFLAAALVGIAFAETPTAHSVTVGNTGAAAWTNTRDYVAMKLVNIEAFQCGNATSTVTITRIRSARTNTVGTITCSSSAGIYRETNTTYLFKGDILNFAVSAPATNVDIEITGANYP